MKRTPMQQPRCNLRARFSESTSTGTSLKRTLHQVCGQYPIPQFAACFGFMGWRAHRPAQSSQLHRVKQLVQPRQRTSAALPTNALQGAQARHEGKREILAQPDGGLPRYAGRGDDQPNPLDAEDPRETSPMDVNTVTLLAAIGTCVFQFWCFRAKQAERGRERDIAAAEERGAQRSRLRELEREAAGWRRCTLRHPIRSIRARSAGSDRRPRTPRRR
jgi:hypothetical protein